jgi:putative salt-induced outer membrane protein YdiY
MKKIIILSLLITIFPSVSFAKKPMNEEEKQFNLPLKPKGYIEIGTGMGIGGGNIDNQNISVAGKIALQKDKFTNETTAKFQSVDAKNGKIRSMNKVANKTKYDLSNDNYAFLGLETEDRSIAGINKRNSEYIGLGRVLGKKDNLTFTGELGAGLRQTDYKTGLKNNNSYLGKIGGLIDYQLSDSTNIQNETFMAFTDESTQTVSDTQIKSYLVENLYVKGGVEVENNTKTPNNYKKTDTISSVGIGYSF